MYRQLLLAHFQNNCFPRNLSPAIRRLRGMNEQLTINTNRAVFVTIDSPTILLKSQDRSVGP
jgi:hypothetical protein